MRIKKLALAILTSALILALQPSLGHSQVPSPPSVIPDYMAGEIFIESVSVGEGTSGNVVFVQTSYEALEGLYAFSLSVLYGPQITIEDVSIDDTIVGEYTDYDPGFVVIGIPGSSSDPAVIDCIKVAILFSFYGDIVIPPPPIGTGHTLLKITYSVAEDSAGEPEAFTLGSSCGSPVVPSKLILDGSHSYGVSDGLILTAGEVSIGTSVEIPFIRGDANGDGLVEISDVIRLFGYHFGTSGDLPCQDAADVNDDGIVDIADGIALLTYLFMGGTPPAAPFPSAGFDSTADTLSSCVVFAP